MHYGAFQCNRAQINHCKNPSQYSSSEPDGREAAAGAVEKIELLQVASAKEALCHGRQLCLWHLSLRHGNNDDNYYDGCGLPHSAPCFGEKTEGEPWLNLDSDEMEAVKEQTEVALHASELVADNFHARWFFMRCVTRPVSVYAKRAYWIYCSAASDQWLLESASNSA